MLDAPIKDGMPVRIASTGDGWLWVRVEKIAATHPSDKEEVQGVKRDCMRCGDPALWLVTHPQDQSGSAISTGRVLVYCESCRHDRPVAVAVPLTVLDRDPDLVLGAIYEEGYTRSDPTTVAEFTGASTRGRWFEIAQRLVGE